MQLSLPPTFIDAFWGTRRPAVVIGGRLYTARRISGESNGQDYCQLQGDRWELRESEEISELEMEIFDAARLKVERFMRWVVDFKLRRRANDRAEQLRSAQEQLQEHQDRSIEHFIMTDVFNEFNRESNKGSKRAVEKPCIFQFHDIPVKLPRVEDLSSGRSCLDRLLEGRGFLIAGDSSYTLAYDRQRCAGRFVHFSGKTYNAHELMPTLEIGKRYKYSLIERVEATAIRNGAQYAKALAEIASLRKRLDESIKALPAEQESSEKGSIGFRKEGSSKYCIYVNIPEFLMGKNMVYYHFATVQLGTTLCVKDRRMKINSAAKVISGPYRHPFVGSGGSICYSGAERWRYLNVRFNHYYPVEEPSLPYVIAAVLRQGVMLIQRGYMGGNVSPINNITSFSPVANGRKEAEEYCREHGISEERIIETDQRGGGNG